MKYDPSFFFEREQFIQHCRAKIESQNADEDWRTCMHELISFWENIMDQYRDYVNCYNLAEKKVQRKSLKRNVREFNKCLRMVKGSKHEVVKK